MDQSKPDARHATGCKAYLASCRTKETNAFPEGAEEWREEGGRGNDHGQYLLYNSRDPSYLVSQSSNFYHLHGFDCGFDDVFK